MPGADDGGVVLTREAARRIADAVKQVERMASGRVNRIKGPNLTAPSRLALTTSTITAGNPTATPRTLGKGTATLLLITIDPATGDGTYAPIPPATGLADVTIYHGGPSEIATGRVVQVKVIDGVYVVDVDYCP